MGAPVLHGLKSHPTEGGARPRLVLASQSPRRRLLLSEHGVEHEALEPGVDDGELRPGRVTPAQWTAALAYLKAAAGTERAGAGSPLLLLGADTVCVKGVQIIGQPRDAGDAERILRLLENGTHEVITGVALVWTSAEGERVARQLFVDRARVHVGTIGSEAIRSYIESGEWRGKAGAYNLSERIAAGWPIRFEGDPSTIMGLPMTRLVRELARAGVGPSRGAAA